MSLCESEHFDPKALEIITSIAKRLRQCENGGCLAGQDDWFKLQQLPDPQPALLPLSIIDSNQVAENERAAKRFADVMVTLKTASEGLQKIQAYVYHQMKFCETQNRVLRWRSGLSYLPDELLVTILEYSSNTYHFVYDRVHEGMSAVFTTRAVIRLSHVCRRFRRVAMRLPMLWSRICNRMRFELVSTLCQRVTTPTAEIFLVGHPKTNAATFIRTVVPHANNWRRFIHGRIIYDERASDEELQELTNVAANVRAPFLTELAIFYTAKSLLEAQNPDIKENKFHYYSKWSAPRLRTLKMYDMVPVPFTSASTLVCLDVGLTFIIQQEESPFHMSANTVNLIQSGLVRFLLSCPALKTFSWSLNSLQAPNELSTRSPVEFTNIEEFNFECNTCEASQAKVFFDELRFPNASTVKMKFTSHLIRLRPQDLLRTIFPNSAAFPRLERLELEFFVYVTWEGGEDHRTIDIPNFHSSNIQHLTLTMGNCLLGSIPDGQCLPALRSLTFNGCECLEKDWVAKFIGRLKDQGNMPQITVERCKWMPRRMGEDSQSESSEDDSEEELDPSTRPYITADDILSVVA